MSVTHSLGSFQPDAEMLTAVEDVLKSGWLSPGPKVKEFENAVANFHRNAFGVMVNSGTDALRIALLAMKEKYGWKDGDEVICPSVTFVATLNTVLQAGLKPVLADVGMYDFNINPWNIRRRFFEGIKHKNIRAIIPVHVAGKPCDMVEIMKLAKEYRLKVIEDSCEAIAIAGIGVADVTCFSFYMAHILTTGVGGMAITNDLELRDLMWSYANHGRKAAKGFVFERQGYSSRATEFEAVLGLAQLSHLPEIIVSRRVNARYLYDRLKYQGGIHVNYFSSSACMFFPIVLNENVKWNKLELLNHLTEEGIETRELLPIIHQPCFEGLFPEGTTYSVAEWVGDKGFYIGCHQDLTQEVMDKTCNLIKNFFSRRMVYETLPASV